MNEIRPFSLTMEHIKPPAPPGHFTVGLVVNTRERVMHFSALLVPVFVFCLGWVDCRVDITTIPQTQRNFDLNKYLGVWYDQAKVAPCSFGGSSEFTDWKLDFITEGDRFLLVQHWRNADVCVNIQSVLTERQPGCYTVKDPIGDVFSGEQKVVATDYKRFSITWGCTRRSLDGQKCRDPWLSVETRKVHPDAYTFKVIDAVLQKLFGFGIDQTLRVRHGNRVKKITPSDMMKVIVAVV